MAAGGQRKSAASVAPFEKAARELSPGADGAPKLRASVRKNFASSRLAGEIHKPWLDKRDGRETVARWFYIVFSLMGLVGGGLLAYFNFKKIPRLGKVCLMLDEQFNSLDTNIWYQEVEVGGFGNGEFEWTTTSSNNSFVEDGILYIVPTLTEDVLGRDAVYDGQNITVSGCTAAKAPNTTNCITYSNSTLGKVLNPVMSARLTTKISHSIKYGRVEVRARMPTGDWLWPAIWMLPTNNTYGEWPASGEIDIAESRGNGWKYGAMGSDWITSTIHWGPITGFDSAWRTTGKWQDRHGTYSDKWHTYVVEWDEKFMWIYLDKRTVRIFNYRFKKPFWEKGEFPPAFYNGTHYDALPNPWQGRGNVAPFDQEFYLILNVAVGGTNGWFPDNIGDKPWFDNSPTAMKDFIEAKDKWYPTWPTDVKKRGMAIDWVRMYQKC
ncbi:concanavalin A-like lectin/glucanase [Auricularia subglabra TFB-10046 SS5]|nr:concanavalin A-like lectin/glucanase [Auricularia subglabra TFB-10046 SS5]